MLYERLQLDVMRNLGLWSGPGVFYRSVTGSLQRRPLRGRVQRSFLEGSEPRFNLQAGIRKQFQCHLHAHARPASALKGYTSPATPPPPHHHLSGRQGPGLLNIRNYSGVHKHLEALFLIEVFLVLRISTSLLRASHPSSLSPPPSRSGHPSQRAIKSRRAAVLPPQRRLSDANAHPEDEVCGSCGYEENNPDVSGWDGVNLGNRI